MDAFEQDLEAAIGRPSTERPFVCSGHPSSCTIWVVGYNAATAGGDWWRFWSSDTGFDYDAWRRDYDAERVARRVGPSATRRRIDRLKLSLPDLLETNIFSTPSTAMANMPKSSTLAFDLLLRRFTPRAIIAHGGPAAKHLESWTSGKLLTCRHFRLASYAEIDAMIEELRQL